MMYEGTVVGAASGVVVEGTVVSVAELVVDSSAQLGHLVNEASYVTADGTRIPIEATDHVKETFAYDKDRWAAANVAKRKVHVCHGNPGLFATSNTIFTQIGPCVPPWTAHFIFFCPIICAPQMYWATCGPHRDVLWPEHADKALIITDKGLIGRDDEGKWNGMSWHGVGSISVQTYTSKRCVTINDGAPWADPLAWIIPCGLLLPCCGYVCVQPNTPGLYHAVITSKNMTVTGHGKSRRMVPTATINLMALAASPDELVEAIKRANGGSAPAEVKGLTMER